STIHWRISDWRNFGASFWNYGRAISNWDSSASGILGSYALSALYGQFLRLETGDYTIFSHILDYYQSAQGPTANLAIESGAAGTVFDGMRATEINASFRIALNFKSAFGLYGFHDDNAYSTLMPMLTTRPTISAAVGGAVTIKPTDGIYDPSLYTTSDSFVAYCIKYKNVEMSNTLFGFSGEDWVTINPDNGKVENRLATAFSDKKVIASEIYNDYVYGFTLDKAFIMHHLDMQPTFFDKSVEVYDMSYDYSSNTMYVLGKVGTSKHGLYSMNLETCALTLLKEIDSTGTPISITFDSNGKLYVLTSESGNGVLCEINKGTGKATKIGNTELTIAYTQSMNYDHDNGILYLASSSAQGKGLLAILNTDNGFAFIIRSSIGEVNGLYSIPTYISNPSARYLSYRITGGAATITNCSKNAEGVITIPNTVQGYPVTAIASSAFSGCSAITEVMIPDSIKTIGASAFAACVGLKSIQIPKSVTSIDSSAFSDCVNLTAINVDANNPNFSTHLGSVYNKNRTTLLICPAGFTGEFSVAPETMTIGSSAFKNCLGVAKITLSVQTIEANAFFNCKGLVELELLSGLKTIGDSAFRNCIALEEIAVPDSVTTIGANAFRDCSSATSATLPENLTKISDYLFTNCTSLQSIELPKALDEIGAYAFNKCTSMQIIEIPENVTTIKNYAFNASSLLRGAQFLGDAPNSFGTKVFDGCSPMFTIYYDKAKVGWTSPTWNGYKTSTDEMPTYILGDANCDNLVNTGDAVLILKHAAGMMSLQGNSFYAADFNLDGKVNTGDATLILVKCVA
ncbi:MAG: leucine-rich repeat protein, partial [Clostridiales bacterium]|nr:leucine-rich repeat protein [Clostridiales bacterium]